jgi:hypothetical protein
MGECAARGAKGRFMIQRNGIDKAALAKVVVESGVRVTPAELDALAGSLERITAAAATLLQPISIDEAPESFRRQLEGGGAGEAER